MNSKVSVIVPVFNGGPLLEKSVASIQQQTLKELEIIIVNDSSTNDTQARLDVIASADSRVKVIHLSENLGVYQARAVGIKAACSEWIGFIDADDFAKPNMFETLFVTATRNKVDVVICESDRVTSSRKLISPKVRFKSNELIQDNIYERFCYLEFGMGSLCNKLYKTELIQKSGAQKHNWRQDSNEDTLVNIGVFHEVRSIYLLQESLHEYTFNEASATSTIENESAFIQLLKAYFLALKRYQKFDDQALQLLTELYRRQLDWSPYRLDKVSLTPKQWGSLTPLFEEACKHYPVGVMTLISRRPLYKVERTILGFKVPKVLKNLKRMIIKN